MLVHKTSQENTKIYGTWCFMIMNYTACGFLDSFTLNLSSSICWTVDFVAIKIKVIHVR
jgi:hypothetical protein